MDISQAGPAASDSTDQAASSKAAAGNPSLAHADSSLSSGNSHSGAMPMLVDDDAMFQKKPSTSSKTESAQVGLPTVPSVNVFLACT